MTIDHVIVVPKTWRSELRSFLAFIALGVLGVYLTARFPGSVIRGEVVSLFGHSVFMDLPLFWFMPFAALSTGIMRIYNVHFVIDNRGIHCTSGIMSFHQRTTSIRFEDVRGISLEQTIIERTLGIGDVLIGTAATGDTEVTFQGIAVPEEVQHMITTERDKRQKVARQSLQSVESSAFATGVVS